jgi:hypothetical protein
MRSYGELGLGSRRSYGELSGGRGCGGFWGEVKTEERGEAHGMKVSELVI